MYYLIKGVLHDRENPEIIEGTFEWAVKSEEEKEYNKRLFIESNWLVENYKSVIRRSFGALSLIALR